MSKNRTRHKPNPKPLAKTGLSDDDVRRIDGVLFALARRGNGFALGMANNLTRKTIEDKRRIIAGIYLMAFEMMAAINMAVESEKNPIEVLMALRGLEEGDPRRHTAPHGHEDNVLDGSALASGDVAV